MKTLIIRMSSLLCIFFAQTAFAQNHFLSVMDSVADLSSKTVFLKKTEPGYADAQSIFNYFKVEFADNSPIKWFEKRDSAEYTITTVSTPDSLGIITATRMIGRSGSKTFKTTNHVLVKDMTLSPGYVYPSLYIIDKAYTQIAIAFSICGAPGKENIDAGLLLIELKPEGVFVANVAFDTGKYTMDKVVLAGLIEAVKHNIEDYVGL